MIYFLQARLGYLSPNSLQKQFYMLPYQIFNMDGEVIDEQNYVFSLVIELY